MSKKAFDYELSDPELTSYVNACEAKLRFPVFDANLGSPFVLFAGMAGNVEKLGAGIAYQIEGKARVVEHNGVSTFGAKAFAAMMGWEVEKMGLYRPDYIVNGGGFPIRLTNCPTPVGAIIVSGMPDAEDHQFIVDSLEEFIPTIGSVGS